MKYLKTLCVIGMLLSGCGSGNGSPEGTAADDTTMPVDTLQVEFVIGEELGDSTNTFSSIVAAMVLDDGRILVQDQVEGAMKLYTPAGEYISHIARRGSGPGELGMPWGMFSFPDGRIAALDLMKQGFVIFDDSPEYLEELALWPQNPPFQGTAVSDSQFVAYKISQEAAESRITVTRTVALYEYGEEDWEKALWQDSIETTMSDLMRDPSVLIIDTLDPLSICSGPAGNVYFSLKDGEDYTITELDLAGQVVRKITLELSPVEKTDEEIAAESTYVTNYVARMSGGGGGFQFEFNPDPYKDMVVDLAIGPDGNLWARRGTRPTPFFDVYDPATGELLRHVVFPEEGWSWILSVSENGILAWEEDPELGYQQLYRL